MSKKKSSEIPHYELLYIISNKFTEEETKPIIEKVNKVIERNQGKITFQEEWGKKKLAYSIENFIYGYYVLVEYDLPGESAAKVNKELKMSNEILRHQIVAKTFKTKEERETEKKQKEERIVKEKEEERKEEEEKIIPVKQKQDVNMEDLDAKLDKILDTDDLL